MSSEGNTPLAAFMKQLLHIILGTHIQEIAHCDDVFCVKVLDDSREGWRLYGAS